MNLYLIRHAEAVPLGEGGATDDADRPLTERGREQARGLAAAFQRQGIGLAAVVTSPLLRSRQTAELLVEAWSGPKPELRVCEELAPAGRRKKLSRYLRDLGGGDVAVVGHQPDLGEYAAWLVGSRKARLDLAKGGAAYVVCDDEVDKGSGALVWMLTPEWLGSGPAGD